MSDADAAATEPAVAATDSLFAWIERSGGVRIKAARRIPTAGPGPDPDPGPGSGPPGDGAPAGPQGPIGPPAQVARADGTPPALTHPRVTKRRLRLRFRLSEPAALTITVQRVMATGEKRRIVVLKRDGKRGLNTIGLPTRTAARRLPAGPYRAMVQATDASGNRSKRVAAVFRIPKAPAR